MATYIGRTDKEPDRGAPHLAAAFARDIEFGHFDSELILLANAVAERQKTIVAKAITGIRSKP